LFVAHPLKFFPGLLFFTREYRTINTYTGYRYTPFRKTALSCRKQVLPQSNSIMATVKHTTPSEAFSITRKGALLVDVREEREIEHKAFDVPEVMAVPLSRFESSFRDIPQKRKVIVVCRSGSRSTAATSMLMSRGYRNVVNLQHGIIGWERAGLPVKRKEQQGLLARMLQRLHKQN